MLPDKLARKRGLLFVSACLIDKIKPANKLAEIVDAFKVGKIPGSKYNAVNNIIEKLKTLNQDAYNTGYKASG